MRATHASPSQGKDVDAAELGGVAFGLDGDESFAQRELGAVRPGRCRRVAFPLLF